MKSTVLVENNGETQKIYNSILLSPKSLNVVSSDLSQKIIGDLVKAPACAMDVARNLGQHEQKIYYHLRRLESAGIIKLINTEKRYGMNAKIYDIVSPVIATKLHNNGYIIKSKKSKTDPEISKFLEPFIKDGKLNATIIVGDPYPHGEYDQGGLDGCYIADLTLFIGNFLDELPIPCYRLDTHVKEIDLKNNLIILGGPKFNVIAHQLNKKRILPIYFDEKKDFQVISSLSNNTYKENVIGVITRFPNPFNKDKEILLIGGKRPRGTGAAVIAFTKNTRTVMQGNASNNKHFANVIVGRDRTGDGDVDTIEFRE
ncbi:MAG: helix-turn-helix domain-containing protein [Candidatus Aenigmatarchaeota archaeon]